LVIIDILFQATPIATPLSQHLPQSFFARPAEQVAPKLLGCLMVTRQPNGELLLGVIEDIYAVPRMMYVLCRYSFLAILLTG